jgi:HSP20 family protein
MKEQVAIVVPKPEQAGIQPTPNVEFWERLDQIMKQIAIRAFQLFEERGHENGNDLQDWYQAEAELLTPVPIKLVDAHNELCIKAEVPGFTADELAFNLDRNTLTIQGARKTYTERGTDHAGSESTMMICQEIMLPSEVIPENAEATLRNGLLKIVVPKPGVLQEKTKTAHAA